MASAVTRPRAAVIGLSWLLFGPFGVEGRLCRKDSKTPFRSWAQRAVKNRLAKRGATAGKRRHTKTTETTKNLKPVFQLVGHLQLNSLVWARAWCIPELGAENKSALFQNFAYLFSSEGSRAETKPHQTSAETLPTSFVLQWSKGEKQNIHRHHHGAPSFTENEGKGYT